MTSREKELEKSLKVHITDALREGLPPIFNDLLLRYDPDGKKQIQHVVDTHASNLAELLADSIYEAIAQSIRGIKFEGCLGITTIGGPTTQSSIPFLPKNKVSGAFFNLKNLKYTGLPITPNYFQISVE